MKCQNNLKQVGLACHQYHDPHRSLPPGYLASVAYPDTTPGWGWPAFLLPYIEQENLYRQIDFRRPVEQSSAVQLALPIFLCPSDASPPPDFPVTDGTLTQLCTAAPSCYAATVGQDASEVDAPTGDGVFFR